MKPDQSELEALIKRLLADPDYRDSPVTHVLGQLWQQHRELLNRMERITRVSDVYQSLAREREMSLSERFDKQLRQLEKVARISDRYQHMMRDLNLALREASTRDSLTGIANRRLLVERLKAEVERSERQQHVFSVAMIDIDYFKRVNDQYGHEVGDTALIEITRVMEAEVREYDLCGRWGGEEFLILLPETSVDTSLGVIERMRDSIRTLAVRVGDQALSLTVSCGLAQHQPGESYSETIKRADNALLAAKRGGRDRCEVA
ncbi:GGDEF domain-containing protein [Chitinimonas naiadis]